MCSSDLCDLELKRKFDRKFWRADSARQFRWGLVLTEGAGRRTVIREKQIGLMHAYFNRLGLVGKMCWIYEQFFKRFNP